ncbi:MAG: hypothetical protein HYU39_04505 [Thaumarchaeota archaeon]|nr:hypothetical protein [Nitrososphaerota archaeon]
MTTPYEDMMSKMLQEKKHRLRWLEDSSGDKKEIRLLTQEIGELEARLKSYDTGVDYFRKKRQHTATH